MNLLLLTFGPDLHNHQQAAFALLTQLAESEVIRRVVVMTDAPEYYAFAQDERVTVRVLSPEVLRDWRGPHDFFWRIKIRALQEMAARFPDGHLLYTDADTFRFRSLQPVVAGLDRGENFMHAREGALAELRTRTERRMWKQIRGKSFAGLEMTDRRVMYNAGVVALPRSKAAATLDLALTLCDALCAAGVTRRLIEQFALSLALAETGPLRAANGSIGHYWGNKEGWNEVIRDFLVRHQLQRATFAELVEATRTVDFRAVPIYSKSSSTQRKLRRFVDARFGKRTYAYVPEEGGEVDERSERWVARREGGGYSILDWR